MENIRILRAQNVIIVIIEMVMADGSVAGIDPMQVSRRRC
jgi:hypothetical protein